MTDGTVDTFTELVRDGNVLVDFWGPNCAPCVALMPKVEELAERFGENLRLVKVNAPENRQVCRDLRVFGLPTYLLFRDGREVERLTGDPSLEDIGSAVESLVRG
jgi:thioredoxin 1